MPGVCQPLSNWVIPLGTDPPSSIPTSVNSVNWQNVSKMTGVTGSGTNGDPWIGWDTQVNTTSTYYYFPAGFYDFNPFTISATGVHFVGDGMYNTNLRCLDGTVNCITVTSPLATMEGFELLVKTTITPSAGYFLQVNAGAGFNLLDYRMGNFFGAIQTQGSLRTVNGRLFPTIAATTAIHVLNANTNTFRDITMSISANITTAWDIEYNSGTGGGVTDTVDMLGCTVYSAGTNCKCIWVHGDTQAPQWVHVVGGYYESQGNSSGVHTIVLDAGKGIRFTNAYILGGQNTLSCQANNGLFHDFVFSNCTFIKSYQAAISVSFQQYLQLIGCTVAGASQVTTNTYACVALGANADGFSMIGGFIRGPFGFSGNVPSYGIQATGGSKNIYIEGVTIPAAEFGTGSSTGLVPTLASAATFTPLHRSQFVSGVAAIGTINVPSWVSNGTRVTFIPTGLFTWTAAGNIALAGNAVVNKALDFTYDVQAAKWYPSYIA